MFSQNLKMLRKRRGLSQEALAERLHVVRQTISKWEKGLSVPDADMLIRLADVLETTVAGLLGEPETEHDDKSTISVQLEQLNALLAEKNSRSRRIWRTVIIVLISAFVLYVVLAIAGVLLYGITKDPVSGPAYETTYETHVALPEE